jgi:hypothetical protein
LAAVYTKTAAARGRGERGKRRCHAGAAAAAIAYIWPPAAAVAAAVLTQGSVTRAGSFQRPICHTSAAHSCVSSSRSGRTRRLCTQQCLQPPRQGRVVYAEHSPLLGGRERVAGGTEEGLIMIAALRLRCVSSPCKPAGLCLCIWGEVVGFPGGSQRVTGR